MSQAFTLSATSSRRPAAAPAVAAALLPIIAVVFIAFLVIGLALPVLPLHGAIDSSVEALNVPGSVKVTVEPRR